MPYTLEFKTDGDLLIVELSGKRLLEHSLAAWDEIVREGEARGAMRLLIISKVQGNHSTLDAYSIAEHAARSRFAQGRRFALVDPDLESFPISRFSELVARNRGVNAKVCNDLEEALAFLQE